MSDVMDGGGSYTGHRELLGLRDSVRRLHERLDEQERHGAERHGELHESIVRLEERLSPVLAHETRLRDVERDVDRLQQEQVRRLRVEGWLWRVLSGVIVAGLVGAGAVIWRVGHP